MSTMAPIRVTKRNPARPAIALTLLSPMKPLQEYCECVEGPLHTDHAIAYQRLAPVDRYTVAALPKPTTNAMDIQQDAPAAHCDGIELRNDANPGQGQKLLT